MYSVLVVKMYVVVRINVPSHSDNLAAQSKAILVVDKSSDLCSGIMLIMLVMLKQAKTPWNAWMDAIAIFRYAFPVVPLPASSYHRIPLFAAGNSSSNLSLVMTFILKSS